MFHFKVGRHILVCTMFCGMALWAAAASAQTFTVLYTFTGGADGGTPLATPILSNGNVYGTTSGGGTSNAGTVYEVNFASRHEAALHSFSGPDGSGPVAGLAQDSSGNFYGVAYHGGANNDGTLFKLSSKGTFTLLHSFSGPPSQGIGPAGTLVWDTYGDLYGTTYVGGDQKGWGTTFEYSVGGKFTTGQSFSPDGALPRAGLLYLEGKLYGTTAEGEYRESGDFGGTIYEADVQQALYTFTGGADGAQPLGGLVSDGAGNLYGTCSAGGSGNFGAGYGVIFKFNLASGQLTVLHTFTGPDGGSPSSALSWDASGNLYGTTTLGGAYGYGNVFKLSSSGTLTSLHDFTGGADGARPMAGVIVDAKGNVWGAASQGGSAQGSAGYGTVFIISPAAS